jgi:hypothetical protein
MPFSGLRGAIEAARQVSYSSFVILRSVIMRLPFPARCAAADPPLCTVFCHVCRREEGPRFRITQARAQPAGYTAGSRWKGGTER